MKVLVTGGAGYIGSHAVRCLLDQGHQVVVYDNLVKGHIEAIDKRATFIAGHTGNVRHLSEVLRNFSIEAVLHFAAFIEVGESIIDPGKYYENNVACTVSLLKAMAQEKVKKIVFSSTAAVYGNPTRTPIEESDLCSPINPYGRSKLISEMIIQDFCSAYDIGFVILRYFNVAGAWPDGQMGEDHSPETHLIPKILLAAIHPNQPVKIFGTDYKTKDGTCIRDYLHVVDLANAHILALGNIKPGQGNVFNLGSEFGFSVRDVITVCEKVTNKKIKLIEEARRPGDPDILVASSAKIRKILNWEQKYPSLEQIVLHAWLWHSLYPKGYGSPKA